MSKWSPPQEKPLNLKRCDRTDCGNGLHCFLKHRKRKTPEGSCWACGEDVVDWDRVRKMDITDAQHTVQALKQECIRHEFWCTVPITDRALNYALWKGRAGLPDAAKRRIRSAVGKPANDWDGRQTPFEDKPNAKILEFAQHATATCCRKCIAVWHGIPTNRALADSEVDYFAELLVLYVVTRIPDLGNEGIPRRTIRRTGGRQLRKAS